MKEKEKKKRKQRVINDWFFRTQSFSSGSEEEDSYEPVVDATFEMTLCLDGGLEGCDNQLDLTRFSKHLKEAWCFLKRSRWRKCMKTWVR